MSLLNASLDSDAQDQAGIALAIDVFEDQHLNSDGSGEGDITILRENVLQWCKEGKKRFQTLQVDSRSMEASEVNCFSLSQAPLFRNTQAYHVICFDVFEWCRQGSVSEDCKRCWQFHKCRKHDKSSRSSSVVPHTTLSFLLFCVMAWLCLPLAVGAHVHASKRRTLAVGMHIQACKDVTRCPHRHYGTSRAVYDFLVMNYDKYRLFIFYVIVNYV